MSVEKSFLEARGMEGTVAPLNRTTARPIMLCDRARITRGTSASAGAKRGQGWGARCVPCRGAERSVERNHRVALRIARARCQTSQSGRHCSTVPTTVAASQVRDVDGVELRGVVEV